MNGGRVLRQMLGFVVLAFVCALVSNALAGPERKLKWMGRYDEKADAAKASAGTGTPSDAPRPSPPAALPGSSAAPEAAGAANAFPPHPDKPWVEIPGDDVAGLHARGNVLFLDARRTSVYRDGHIAGARSVAVWESDVDDKVKALYQEGLDQSAPIVVYCSGGDCEDSHMLAQKLYFVGFDDVLVYKDGFPDWQKRGLPVHTGDNP